MDERSSLGTVSERFFRNARARNAHVEATSNLPFPAQALEIACFVVQKNYIARCWRKRKSKTQNEALEFLRGEKPRWTEASMARLSANLALRRWRRQMIRADPEALFADAHNDAEVAYILEARRGFEANSKAFAAVLVKYGLLCDAPPDRPDSPAKEAAKEKQRHASAMFGGPGRHEKKHHAKKKHAHKKAHRRF